MGQLRRLLKACIEPARRALGTHAIAQRLASVEERLQHVQHVLLSAPSPGDPDGEQPVTFMRQSLPDGATYELALDRNLTDEYQRQIASGVTRDPTWHCVITLVQPGDVFFDLGAGIGAMSVPAARRGARVHAFELLQDNARLIAAAAERNGLDALSIVIAAVRDRSGCVGFSGKSAWGVVVPDARTSTAAISVDDYVSWMNVGRVDVMKVDVEGSERAVLLGARGLLARDTPDIVIESNVLTCGHAGYSCRDLMRILVAAGYRLFRITRHGLSPVGDATPQEVVLADYLATVRTGEEVGRRTGMAVVPMTEDDVIDSILAQTAENEYHKACVVANRDRLPARVRSDPRIESVLRDWDHLRERPYFAALERGLA